MAVFDALGPVFLLVLIGAALGRWDFPGGDFWAGAERLTYFVFFPALLVDKLVHAPFSAGELGEMLLAVSLLLGGATVLLLAVARLIVTGGAAFTSVYQGSVRINTYVGLAAAERLWGEPGLAVAAIAVACIVPLVNLLCVAVFAVKVGNAGSVWRQIAVNPLILACALGIALNLAGIGLPGWTASVLALLGAPALPVGLLAVGVGLAWTGLSGQLLPLAISSTMRLAILPVAAWLVGRWLGLEGLSLFALVLFFAIPTAPSAFILARQLGGDARMMAALITGQTLIAMGTLPLVLFWLTGP